MIPAGVEPAFRREVVGSRVFTGFAEDLTPLGGAVPFGR